SSIPRYEQRLRCLFIITTFKERLDDVATNIQAITNASISISNSKRLRYLLRLILAVGNYLNYGKRNGNAFGFALDSLCVLTDVRNSLRSDQNLLHYIIQIADAKFPDILRLKRDFGGVHDASRHRLCSFVTVGHHFFDYFYKFVHDLLSDSWGNNVLK
ncbi:Disheveled-associated activator of morphogenesis 2, partial [Toxocara canis]